MKIDYDLVESIGAEYYCENSNEYYKTSDMDLLYYSFSRSEWRLSTLRIGLAIKIIKPIPPKPQVRVEYEKITCDFWLLKDLLESGELYHSLCEGYSPIDNIRLLSQKFEDGDIYRRTEKPVDLKSEIERFIDNSKFISFSTDFDDILSNDDHEKDFLEICRVALRATGEL